MSEIEKKATQIAQESVINVQPFDFASIEYGAIKMGYWMKERIIDKPCEKAYRPNRKPQTFTQTKTGYPKQLLQFDKDCKENLHPTQKPVELIRYLIRTYTNEGDTVLDSCCGSGTTAIAAIMEKRNWICIEKSEEYFNIAKKRIENELNQPTLF